MSYENDREWERHNGKKSVQRKNSSVPAGRNTPQRKSSSSPVNKNAAQRKTAATTKRSKGGGRKNEERGKSRSRSRLLSVLTYIMIVFAFVALMVTLSLTVFFKIDSIKVSIGGEEYYTAERIAELSGITEGQNIFSLDFDEIEERIEKELPYIERCDIKMVLPAGVKIKVTGAQPAGVVTMESGVRVIVSDEGKLLEMLAPYDESAVSETDVKASPTDISATDTVSEQSRGLPNKSAYIDESTLPEVVGLETNGEIKPGEYVEAADETALATLKRLTGLLEEYELPPTKIDLSAGNLYAYYDNRIIIRIGSGAGLEEKIRVANEIIKNMLSEYDSGRVDVTNPKKAYFTPEYALKQNV